MKATSSSEPVSGPRSGVWLMLLLIFVILSVLFRYVYVPELTQFSNDGPIGNLNTQAHKAMKEFFGGWQDLNSVGIREPAWPGITWCLFGLLGPVAFSKLYAPVGLLLLGLGAWTFFRTMRFALTACILGGLAAMLNSGFFSVACWGVVAHTNTIAMTFFAMAALVSAKNAESWVQRWVRIALAGLAVGMGVAEGADLGAIFSVYVAVFAMFLAWNSEEKPVSRIKTGAVRVGVVALFAVFLAAQPLSVLIRTGITDVKGTQSKQDQWAFATQTSLPKSEALCLLVPGLFGYRMDTPLDMSTFESKYHGGAYWGQAGRDMRWETAREEWIKNGKQGPAPIFGNMRYTGGGNYTGVFVVLIAVWVVFQSFRGEKSVFPLTHRKWIWFWAVIAVGSLLLAFGRYAPFYQLLYQIPKVSAIRNPSKYTHAVNLALVVLFGFGVHGLCRQYLQASGSEITSLKGHFKNWWAKVSGFDRKWVIGCAVAFLASIIGWLIYSSSRPSLEEYIASVAGGSMTGDTPQALAAFSIREVGWFVLFFFLAIALLVFVLSGWFAGKRARLGGILLGLLLVVDLGRANQPWLIVWDYEMKYASNPIIEHLREKPYEHRVAQMPRWLFSIFQVDDKIKGIEGYFQTIYGGEWAQHIMLYYNVQSLDIVQMSRMPDDLSAYLGAFVAASSPQELCRMATRQWELTNTRYILGSAPMIELLNRFFDPVQHRFQIVKRFDFAGKPGITQPTRPVEQTAVLSTNGMFALFEFTGALPRAKLYANWEVSTNADATLRRLASAEFDPHKAVIVTEPIALPAPANATNANPGSVEFSHYEPNHVILKANANAPSILLLNDRFEENWKVSVDGKPAKLLRGNFIMRAVQLEPGQHTVDYRYAPPVHLFYVTSSAIVLGVVLLCFIAISNRRKESPVPQPEPKTAPTAAKK
jgi:hypothetical protein